mgnify:CR=1 FL=1
MQRALLQTITVMLVSKYNINNQLTGSITRTLNLIGLFWYLEETKKSSNHLIYWILIHFEV